MSDTLSFGALFDEDSDGPVVTAVAHDDGNDKTAIAWLTIDQARAALILLATAIATAEVMRPDGQ